MLKRPKIPDFPDARQYKEVLILRIFMKERFIIEFDFPLEHTAIRIHLQAVAEWIDTSSCLVHSIRSFPGAVDGACLLPEQRIKYIEKTGQKSWVHVDSEKETELSMAIGKAIEEVSSNS